MIILINNFMNYSDLKIKKIFSSEKLCSDLAILLYFALTKFLILLLVSSDFGFHRDEFLYLAMGDNIGWGYLEVPPSIAIYAKISTLLFGDSIFSIRFFPALTGALTLLLTGLITKELGGKRFAQILAALCYLFSLLFLRINILFQPVTFDLFYFVLCAYLLIRILKRDDKKLWLMLGLFTGLGLLNKYTMLLFGFGVAVALLFTSYRKLYLNKWLWVSAGIAVILFLPNLFWQFSRDWPVFEHLAVLTERQLSNVDPITFVITQLLMNLYTTPIWLFGLIFCFISGKDKYYRPIGWIYVSIFAVLLLSHGKAYYLAPAYPMLLAAGSAAIEKYVIRTRRMWLKPAIIAFVVIGSSSVIPIGIPVFSVNSMIKYFDFGKRYMGMAEALRWETGEYHELPQDFADMLGWEEMIAAVAETYHSLPENEKEKCAIFASNYGEAGALDYYGSSYGLPKSISKAGSFWHWGYRDYSGEIIITMGWDKDIVQNYYNQVSAGGQFDFPHARENGMPIFIGRQPKMAIEEMWGILKQYRY